MKYSIQLFRIALIKNENFSTEALIHIGGTQTWSAEDDEQNHIFLTKKLNIFHDDGGVNSELLQLRDFLRENDFNAFQITDPVKPKRVLPENINTILHDEADTAENIDLDLRWKKMKGDYPQTIAGHPVVRTNQGDMNI